MFVHNFKYPLPKISKNDIVVQFDGHQKSILSEISITETNLLLILKLKVLQTIFCIAGLDTRLLHAQQDYGILRKA